MDIIKKIEQDYIELAKKIYDVYFRDEEDETYDFDWVGDNPLNGILVIGEFYLDIDYLITALKYKATKKTILWLSRRIYRERGENGI